MITKNEYIARYKKILNNMAVTKDFKIDDDFIYYHFVKDGFLKYEINKIVELLNFFNKFKKYIYNLKIDDEISIQLYGTKEIGKIKKISYKRKLTKKGNKIISSITIKNMIENSNFEQKIKMENITYNDIQFETILDIARHFYSYMFFSEYDIEKADIILKTLKRGF